MLAQWLGKHLHELDNRVVSLQLRRVRPSGSLPALGPAPELVSLNARQGRWGWPLSAVPMDGL